MRGKFQAEHNPKTKLWDWQQNFPGLVVIYVPHIQEIPSPEGLSLGG